MLCILHTFGRVVTVAEMSLAIYQMCIKVNPITGVKSMKSIMEQHLVPCMMLPNQGFAQ